MRFPVAFWLGIAAVIGLPTGCTRNVNEEQPVPVVVPAEEMTEIRALWVTRWDYTKPDDIDRIFQNAADCNFNVVLFQVRGNATTFYPSRLEPWAWELTGKDGNSTGRDPGWDPLHRAVEQAHARGLEIHAYVNVFPAWKGIKPPPEEVPQLWNTHRQWFMVNEQGERMWPQGKWSEWYTFLEPALPAVRTYLLRVFVELAEEYDIDGIHYDYIRYPGEVGDWSHHSESRRMFAEAHSEATPQSAPEAWDEWRRDAVSSLVRANHTALSVVRPELRFSAACLGDAERAFSRYFQDGAGWLSKGWLDIAFCMDYTTDNEEFQRRLGTYLAGRERGTVAAGIAAHRNTAENINAQIELSRSMGADGVALFAYSSFFPEHNPGEKATSLVTGPFQCPARPPWEETAFPQAIPPNPRRGG